MLADKSASSIQPTGNCRNLLVIRDSWCNIQKLLTHRLGNKHLSLAAGGCPGLVYVPVRLRLYVLIILSTSVSLLPLNLSDENFIMRPWVRGSVRIFVCLPFFGDCTDSSTASSGLQRSVTGLTLWLWHLQLSVSATIKALAEGASCLKCVQKAGHTVSNPTQKPESKYLCYGCKWTSHRLWIRDHKVTGARRRREHLFLSSGDEAIYIQASGRHLVLSFHMLRKTYGDC